MRTRNFSLISLACWLALAPVSAALAAPPDVQEETTAEDAGFLAAVSASKIMRNGTSLRGRSAERRGKIATNGTSLGGRTIRSEGGMTIVSLELPGAARHAK